MTGLAPTCPVDIVLAGSREAGFGHLFASMLFGLDLANRFGAGGRLLLADDFWICGPKHGAYPWAWETLQSIAVAVSSVPAPVGMRVVSAAVTWDQVLEQWACNTRFSKVTIAWRGGCYNTMGAYPSYCHGLLHGAFDRGSLLLPNAVFNPESEGGGKSRSGSSSNSRRNSSIGESSGGGGNRDHGIVGSRGGPVQVLWHFRAGDVVLHMRNDSFLRAKGMLDSGFPRRGVVHRALTERGAGALHRFFPILRESGVHALSLGHERGTNWTKADNPGTRLDLASMRRADVLISTGSSFPLAAAALAPPGGQIHLQFPTKGAASSNVSNMRQSGDFRTLFLRKNTVPLDADGQPLARSYEFKLRFMMEALDAGRAVPPDVAMMAFETWL